MPDIIEQEQGARRDEALNAGSPPQGGDRFARYSLLVLVLAAGVVFLIMIKAFLVPVILAAVTAGLFFPLYSWLLKSTRGRRSLSALVCCATLSLGLLAPAFVAANLTVREAVHLGQRAEPRVRAFLEGNMEEQVRSHHLVKKLHLENVPLRPTFERLAKAGPELAAKAFDIVSRGTLELAFTIGVTFFTMFYFFRDGPEVLAKLKSLSPLAEHDVDELIHRSVSVSRATLKGTLLVALIKGILGGLAFWAFGIPAPVLWGVVMVFLSILPIVGPWLVMYPAALILVLGGHPWQGLVLFLIATFVVGLVDNLLEPLLIGRDSGLPELIVFFSMVGGIGLFGVMGFLVGPVIAALLQVLLELFGKEFRQQLASAHHSVQADS